MAVRAAPEAVPGLAAELRAAFGLAAARSSTSAG